ncbi:MAG: S41 family peptidase [Bacteroidota bacterium]
MKGLITPIWTVLLVICACTDQDRAQEKATPEGLWQQVGYGRFIEVRDLKVQIYDMTSRYCQSSEERDLLDFGEVKRFTKDTLVIQHGIDQWAFTRLERLPEFCPVNGQASSDPELNFQTFWDTFNEHYASFELKGVDWEEVLRKYKPRVSMETTDEELYAILRQMTDLLDDGHVQIDAPARIREEYEQQEATEASRYSKLDEWRLNREIAELYVDTLRNYNAGMIRYGRVGSDIGYVQINSMLMQADYGLPAGLSLRDFYGQYWAAAANSKNEIQRQEEVAGVNMALDRVLRELQGMESWVVDLRFNGGGKDGVAMAIMNHFSGIEKVACTKKAKWKEGFTPKQQIRIIPSRVHFDGKVYLLTSHLTASASELLVLASLADPNFTRIGSSTEGIFSSTLDKTLPNGWDYELSNEVYEDLNGTSYEGTGIIPDHVLDYPRDRDHLFDRLFRGVEQGRDAAIEKALRLEGH